MLDSRRESLSILGKLEISSTRNIIKAAICLALSLAIALLPAFPGLDDAGRWAFFILILGAGLWFTEAIPAFAVSLVIIGLEIAILGRPDGVFAKDPDTWKIFVEPWASPLIWLFFGGFILSAAASKTCLDRWISSVVLLRVGSRPSVILLAVMGLTFLFSMFMSNTATAAMMMAIIAPLSSSFAKEDPFRKGLILGVPFAANLGGMGTIIGSPPNAIAVGLLPESQSLTFLKWMGIGLPPALLLALIMWLFLLVKYPSKAKEIDLKKFSSRPPGYRIQVWRWWLVLLVSLLTIGLWMTGTVHGMPTAVISFIPIVILTATGILDVKDIRKLPWDILLLLAGGLSLGVAVSKTGLAAWIVASLPIDGLPPWAFILALSALAVVLSNFMSNTAAANVLLPVGMAMASGFETPVGVAVALTASCAMCLPISTPPNAIAYSSGKIDAKDFLTGGILVGILAPVLIVFWCKLTL